MDHIHKLEDAAQEKTTSRAEKSNLGAGKSSHKVKECAGRTKRTVVKIPSGRPASATPPSHDSPNFAKEVIPQTTPQIPKRKRSSPSRVSSSVLRVSPLSNLAPTLVKMTILSDLFPTLTKTTIYPLKSSKPKILKDLILRFDPLYRSEH